ncbi:MAG: 50S ribosomal protein L10 [Candidatus Kerfeldbacteria bacterium]|nr:50S ribosomal protein L10 [Candidatus Kerfeldbacteria bacterium]
MALKKNEKEAIVAELTEAFRAAPNVVFVRYAGLRVKDIEELRSKLFATDVHYHVVKKTLLERAFSAAGMGDIKPRELEGQIAVGYSLTDEIAAPKVLAQFAKDHEALQFAGGVVEGKLVDAAYVKKLSLIPSRGELYGKLLGTIQNPVRGFVGVLHATLSGFVYALEARRSQLASVPQA